MNRTNDFLVFRLEGTVFAGSKGKIVRVLMSIDTDRRKVDRYVFDEDMLNNLKCKLDHNFYLCVFLRACIPMMVSFLGIYLLVKRASIS